MIGPVPGDVAAARRPAVLGGLNERIADRVITSVAGDPAKYGLPAPVAPVTEDRVIVSDDVLERIAEGRITPMSDVVSVQGREIRFVGGGSLTPDVVVLATGYRPGASWLPADVVPTSSHGTPDLFLSTFPRTRDDLVLLGQAQVSGGILPLLVQQADVAAYFLKAVADGAPSAEAFRRLRAGSDSAVAVEPASRPGRVASLLTPRAPQKAPTPPARTTGGYPVVDRDQLVGRLRTVRRLFT